MQVLEDHQHRLARRQNFELPHQRLAGLYLTGETKDLDKAVRELTRLAQVELNDNRYAKRIARVYREVLGRMPTPEDVKQSLEFMKISSVASDTGADPAAAGQTAWGRLYQALFASAEFRYRS